MSESRAQEQSLPAATETRLGVARMADNAARQAALERAGPVPSIGGDQRPALPDASRDRADRPVARTAIERSEIERFRTVLGARCHPDATPARLEAQRKKRHSGPSADRP